MFKGKALTRKWKAAVWSPTQRAAQATEGQGGSSQVAELKAIQLVLDIAKREKWPRFYLYTNLWMVANALWGWLNRSKKANWQHRGKPIWAAEIWQDIPARVEKLTVKVRHVDAHVSKSRANEEHHNNEQVDKAAKVKVSQVDLDWQHKGEVFLAHWAHDASGYQGRDATYRWACDRGVDLTDNISQVIHNCETCTAIKQAKWVKPLWYGGRWLKYRYGEAWQIDYITLPQTRQGKHYVLNMVEATTGWLETYPVPHATARNTISGLEKQVLWRHGTPERIESDNGTHFKNRLINTWAIEMALNGYIKSLIMHPLLEKFNGAMGSEVVGFDGKSCLIYTLNKKLINALKDVISLKFKTMQSDGILLHREGQNGDHFTMELTKGKLSLLINLGDTKTHPSNAQINITLGSLLDDQHWHSVLIEHFNNQVNFTVDKHTHHFHAKGEFSYLDLDYELSFGGIPVSGKSGILSQRNFHGCFENIYYNGVNIIDLARKHKSQIYIVGNISFSCLEPQVVPVTFLSSSSFLALPGTPGQDEVFVSFQFRTWNKEGLLLSSKLHQSSGGFLLYLSDGRVKINLHKMGRVLSDIAAGAGLNNGQWHSVSLSIKRNRISVRVDNDITSSAHAVIPLQIYSDVFYFGGCPSRGNISECNTSFGGFQGCMRLISIGDKAMDMISIQQNGLGNFNDLQIDLCGITDRTNDTGFLSYKDHLPVTKIVITDTDRPNSEAAYKLGPLLCHGDTPSEVVFSFDVGNGPSEVIVQSHHSLNDNQWHYVKAERNVKEASLQIDQLPQRSYSAPSDGHIRLQLNSQLFVGGTASRQKGFLGCIRSLRLNGMALDLEERAKITPGVEPGCPGHCSSYEISAYFWTGSSVTYNFQEYYTLAKNSSSHASSFYADMTLTREAITFAFRTTQTPSLLLYVSSFYKEYLSVILTRNGSLQVRYKLDSHQDPDVFSISFKSMADGQLQHVKINREEETLFVEVNQKERMKFSLSSGTEFNAIKSLTLGKILGFNKGKKADLGNYRPVSLTSVPGIIMEKIVLEGTEKQLKGNAVIGHSPYRSMRGKFCLSNPISFYDITGLVDQGMPVDVIFSKNSDVDEETMKANSQGFVGCLSSVQFNHIAPLKAALHQSSSAPVIVKGRFTESSCGTLTGADSTSSETTHSFADHSGPIDEGKPLANAIRSDSAIIGGVIAVVIFILLCIMAIAISIYKKKGIYSKSEAKESENEDSAESALKSELSMQNTGNENQKEYFF
ncbi:hypothetical protein DUI87_03638 [Hirundo rustica rustica]|uniref:Uncharacterized protein n=1 Tax=Hirundo rustica rustica TaxID=333673 RepID=A0A3M0L550_HIRRU|nr:hypothetical protein DUI87_03638 [Hirundo rustica rustica]